MTDEQKPPESTPSLAHELRELRKLREQLAELTKSRDLHACNAADLFRERDELRKQNRKFRKALTLIEHKADQRLQGQYTEKQILGLILHTSRAALETSK